MRKSVLPVALILALLIGIAAPVYGAASTRRAEPLKFGALPILDLLPFYVAQQAGYFEAEGVSVELVPVSSALERDQLVLAGGIDGMVNDLISTGIFNQDTPLIQIVAQARRAYADAPQFRILAAPGSGITSPADLAGVEIGISENSVIHYITQRILEDAGLDAGELRFRTEPNIAVRFQLLMEGQFKAACLPDPLAQAALEGGAILVADDTVLTEQEFSQSVISFRTAVIEDNPAGVEAFLRAWMHAAADINAEAEAYRALWLENTNVPESVKDTYGLPPFPTYAITAPLAWDDTMAWLVELAIIDEAPAYEDSVNPTFVDAIKPAEMGTALPGDPANGAAVFAANGCVGCHAVDNDTVLVGPSLKGFAARAGTTVEGLDAAGYAHQAIVEPGAFVVEGFANIMPAYNTLPESDLNDLIAYLLSLE